MVPHSVYEECFLLTQNEVYTLYLHIFISSLFISNCLNTEPSSEQQLLNLVVYTVFFNNIYLLLTLRHEHSPMCCLQKVL